MPTDEVPQVAPSEPTPGPRDISTLPLIFGTVAVLALAVVMTIAALVATDDDETGAQAGSSVHVALSEFAITPSAVTAAAGGSLHVTNDGTATHNLRVVDTDLITPDLAAGEAGELDISSLEPGRLPAPLRDLRTRRRGHDRARSPSPTAAAPSPPNRRTASRPPTARWTTTR